MASVGVKHEPHTGTGIPQMPIVTNTCHGQGRMRMGGYINIGETKDALPALITVAGPLSRKSHKATKERRTETKLRECCGARKLYETESEMCRVMLNLLIRNGESTKSKKKQTLGQIV